MLAFRAAYSHLDAWQDILRYIEVFYNQVRCHSALGYESGPVRAISTGVFKLEVDQIGKMLPGGHRPGQ